MWRTRAVLSLLYEEIGGLPHDSEETPERRAEDVRRARRRALMVVALDWLAILVLVLFGDRVPILSVGRDEQTVFTLAILVIAAHSGFRLGQLEKLRAVTRAGKRVVRRDPEI